MLVAEGGGVQHRDLKIIRLKTVLARATLCRKMGEGAFPRQMKISVTALAGGRAALPSDMPSSCWYPVVRDRFAWHSYTIKILEIRRFQHILRPSGTVFW